jgi:Rad17 cell cycle checkpoint protein.
MSFVEKYRPQSLRDLIGNRGAIEDLKEWLENWNEHKWKEKGVVIHGLSGTGKTSAALALAKDFGYDAIELNASDKRNYETVKNIAFRGSINKTFMEDGTYLAEGKRS